MSANIPSEVAKSDVIDKVLASGVLGSSKNQISLFKHLLAAKYNNTIEGIKTQDIAARVFARDEDFNTKNDSIVRVEMFRLRGNLESFNQQSETLKLILPKSSYNIQIESISPPVQVEDKPKSFFKYWPQSATAITALVAGIFVLTVAFGSNKKPSDCSHKIPNLEIIHEVDKSDLENFVEDSVRGAASQYSHFNLVDDVDICDYTGVPGYKISHSIFQTDQTFRGNISVLSQSSGDISGSQNFSGIFDNKAHVTGDFSDELFVNVVKITNDLLKPLGPLHRNAIGEKWRNKVALKGYNCIAILNDSYVSDSDEDYRDALACLEKSYRANTSLLDNMGGLVASYVEQAQGIRVATVTDPMERAQEILDEIGDRWLLSAEATSAKIMYESQRSDYNAQSLRETLWRAEKSYGTNPIILGDIAKYSGYMLGDWKMAQRQAEQARSLTSDRANSIYLVDAAYVLIRDVSAGEEKICLKAYSEFSKIANLIVNACAKKYKMPAWYARTSTNLEGLGLGSFSQKQSFMKKARFDDTLIEEVLKH